MTPGRLGLEILLRVFIVVAAQRKKKKFSKRSRLRGSSRSSSFGPLLQVDTAKLCMVLSRWDHPHPCPPHSNTHTQVHMCTFAWLPANRLIFNRLTVCT